MGSDGQLLGNYGQACRRGMGPWAMRLSVPITGRAYGQYHQYGQRSDKFFFCQWLTVKECGRSRYLESALFFAKTKCRPDSPTHSPGPNSPPSEPVGPALTVSE